MPLSDAERKMDARQERAAAETGHKKGSQRDAASSLSSLLSSDSSWSSVVTNPSSTATPPPKRRRVCFTSSGPSTDAANTRRRTHDRVDEEKGDTQECGVDRAHPVCKGDRTLPAMDDRDGWRCYSRPEDWTRRRLMPHYDADLDEHHPEVDVTAEYALWQAYMRSGTRALTNDLDVVFDDVVAFAGDFLDDAAYHDMDPLEPGPDRRLWVIAQPPEVRGDRARRSRLTTVIGEALECEAEGDDDVSGDASSDREDDAASS